MIHPDPLFIYRCPDPDCQAIVRRLSDATRDQGCPCGLEDLTHVATIDPKLWLTALLAAEPEEAARMILELKGGRP